MLNIITCQHLKGGSK